MNTYILIALGVGVLIGFGWVRVRNSKRTKLVKEQGADKEANISRVLECFRNSQNAEVRNNDIQKLLGVSEATATRYLEELEQGGKIRQVGHAGRYVHYELVK